MAERDLSPTPSGYRAGTCHLNNESMCPYVVPQSWGNFLRATSPSTLIHILGSSIFTYPLSIRSHRGPPQKSTARGALSREPLPIMSAEAGVPASGAHVQGYEPCTSVSNITAPPHTHTHIRAHWKTIQGSRRSWRGSEKHISDFCRPLVA